MKNFFSKLGSLASAPVKALAGKTAQTLIQKYAYGLARHAISSLGVLLVAHGFEISGSQEEQLVGAIVTLIAVFASGLNKKDAELPNN